jgi:hypothetical protein
MILAQYAWVVLLACTLLNIASLWRSVRPRVAAHPELAAGYRRLIRGLAFWLSLPWLVMGVGCTIGGVPSFRNFLKPAVGGAFVWAFWVVVIAEFLLLGYWAMWGGGAEALVRHPGLMNVNTESVRRMRWYLAGFSVFGVAWNTGFLIWLACGRL